jgi:hypothetical protein
MRIPHSDKPSTPSSDHHGQGSMPLCSFDLGHHRLWLRSHGHHDVSSVRGFMHRTTLWALVIRIIQHARVIMDGMVELAPNKGPITTRYLNASNTHIRDAALAPRPQRRRIAKADGASTSASPNERLDRIEATLQTYG